MTKYTPNENQARAYYATTRNSEEGVLIREAFEEWSRFLTRVRRDVLTDLSESSKRTAEHAASQGDTEWARDALFIATEAATERDALYPEECE